MKSVTVDTYASCFSQRERTKKLISFFPSCCTSWSLHINTWGAVALHQFRAVLQAQPHQTTSRMALPGQGAMHSTSSQWEGQENPVGQQRCLKWISLQESNMWTPTVQLILWPTGSCHEQLPNPCFVWGYGYAWTGFWSPEHFVILEDQNC